MSTEEHDEHQEAAATTDKQARADAMVDEIVKGLEDGTIQLPDEAFEPVVTSVAPAPPEEWFRCKYGHLQEGEYFMYTVDKRGRVSWRTPPMCRRCEAEWLGNKFRTFGCKAPEPKAEPKVQ
jgi:hypothetical protein